MTHYPIDIANFHDTILQLQGISAIESGVENLEPINAEMLPLSACAHLPHAALWRTGGGLENEFLSSSSSPLTIQAKACSHWNFLHGSSGIARGEAQKFNCVPSRFPRKRLTAGNWGRR